MIKRQSSEPQKRKIAEDDPIQILNFDLSKSVFKTPKKECSDQEEERDSADKKEKFCMSQLCCTFLKKYNIQQKPVTFLAKTLIDDFNVKQRRIYDLMNIMEGLGCVQKLSKGTYQWNGVNKDNFDEVQTRKGDSNSLRHVAARIKRFIHEMQKPISFSEIYEKLSEEDNQIREKEVNPVSLRRRIYECCKVLRIMGCIRKVNKNYEWISQQIKQQNKEFIEVDRFKSPIRRPRRMVLTEHDLIQEILRKYKTVQDLDTFFQKTKKLLLEGQPTTIKKEDHRMQEEQQQ